MSVSALISIGQRALAANYAALQTTGNNIANASTPGYSRQTVELETAGSQASGSGFFGKGVNVATVTRTHDQFLTREAAATQSAAAADASRFEQLQRLEKVFGLGEAGVGYAAGQLFAAFVDVSNKPQDASARQVVLARADDLALRFRSAGEQIDSQQAGVVQEAKVAVSTVNELARQIAGLNQRIASASSTGHAPNDLLDQRDSAIAELGRYLQVTTIAAGDGSVGVFAGGGQKLVLGTQVNVLVARADPFDPSRVALGIDDNGRVRELGESALSGGSLAGLLRFQNHDLADARSLLGRLAAAVGAGVNAQQALGLDLRQPAGSGAPIFAVGAARVLPASTNSAAGTSVAIGIVRADRLQASDYELQADPSGPAGSYRLTRLSDGVQTTIASGDTVDGMRIDIAPPAPAAGDRFLLQPVSNAARDMRRVLDDPRGIAAASPVTAKAGAANTGTATVASVQAASSALDPSLTANIAFTDANGAYSWSLVDASGAATTGSGSWTAGQPIALNGFELRLNGVPAAGDTLVVGKTAFAASDNANANALLALRDRGLVDGETATEAYAWALADIGVRVQGAQHASKMSQGIAESAQAAQTSKSGVNLDEEAARLIQYQQSYQAAAKILQVAQAVFDSVLDIGR